MRGKKLGAGRARYPPSESAPGRGGSLTPREPDNFHPRNPPSTPPPGARLLTAAPRLSRVGAHILPQNPGGGEGLIQPGADPGPLPANAGAAGLESPRLDRAIFKMLYDGQGPGPRCVFPFLTLQAPPLPEKNSP